MDQWVLRVDGYDHWSVWITIAMIINTTISPKALVIFLLMPYSNRSFVFRPSWVAMLAWTRNTIYMTLTHSWQWPCQHCPCLSWPKRMLPYGKWNRSASVTSCLLQMCHDRVHQHWHWWSHLQPNSSACSLWPCTPQVCFQAWQGYLSPPRL